MALLGSLLLDIVAAVLLLLIAAYVCGTSTFGYFKKRGIPYTRPWPFVGNYGHVLFGLSPMSHADTYAYMELKKHRFGGVFQSSIPAVLVCDPELVKMVLTKDFSSLHDHGVPYDEKNDPLSATLFNIPGVRWKNLRSKLSPVFTSGKLKQMLPLMVECSRELSDVLREKAVKKETVQLKEILVRYSTDVIGTCAFGISCHCLKNPQSEFYKASQLFFQQSLLTTLRFLVLSNSKFLARLLPFKVLFPNYHEFFIDLMSDTIKYRKENNVERNDFVQMMMQLQKADENKTEETHPDEVIITDKIIAAQAFFFFVGGQDAIASTVGFALYHMSLDTRLQDDLADEVHSVIRHHDGQITYQGLKEMKLLHMILMECLRMYPPGGVIIREVTTPSYTFPDTDLTLEKGEKVHISVHGLHYDPDIYPEPERFDPYRFTEEATSKRHPFAFLPFGEGPRVCIANRFANLELKLCLAALIKDFKFSVCPETQIPLKFKTFTLAVTPTKGFTLKIEERKMF